MTETKSYRLSNGSEGEWFMSIFCEKCEKDRYESKPCGILGRTFALGIDDKGYPKEWIRDGGDWPGNPRCTAFVERGAVPHAEPNTIKDKRQIGLPL